MARKKTTQDKTIQEKIIDHACRAVESWRADQTCKHVKSDPKSLMIAAELDDRMYQLEAILYEYVMQQAVGS